ncbi:MAG: hypothetical protein CK424_01225 [Legionella sp.]|nr:MAG: hypothetical protein CK424_01225 [Legionella sp.]
MSYSKEYKELQSHITARLNSSRFMINGVIPPIPNERLLRTIQNLTRDFEQQDMLRAIYPNIDSGIRSELCARIHRSLAYLDSSYDPELGSITQEEYESHVQRMEELKTTYFQGEDRRFYQSLHETAGLSFLFAGVMPINRYLLGTGLVFFLSALQENLQGFQYSISSKLAVFSEYNLIRQLPFSKHYDDLDLHIDNKLKNRDPVNKTLLETIKKITTKLKHNQNKQAFLHADVDSVVIHELCGRLHRVLAFLDSNYDVSLGYISTEEHLADIARIQVLRDTVFIGADWHTVQKVLSTVGTILLLTALLVTFTIGFGVGQIVMCASGLFMMGSQVAATKGFHHSVGSKLQFFTDRASQRANITLENNTEEAQELTESLSQLAV